MTNRPSARVPTVGLHIPEPAAFRPSTRTNSHIVIPRATVCEERKPAD